MPDQPNVSGDATPQETPPPAAAEPTPQAAVRAAVYEKIYGGKPAEAPALAQPESTPPVAAAPAQPDYKAQFEQLQNELVAMRQAMTPAPPPAPPAPDWFDLLKEGKRTEAEAAFANKLIADAGKGIVQQSVQEALEMVRVRGEVEHINNDLRVKNPDLVPLEKFIAMDAEVRFRQAQNTIKSPDDYVRVYHESVTSAADEARKLVQQLRAAGKDEAMTIRQEIISSTGVAPNLLKTANRDAIGQPINPGQTEPDMSPSSYLEQRRQAARSGLRYG